MSVMLRVSRTELARNTRRVLSDVQRGRTALIETHGDPEAALLDIVDYRILRAVIRYYGEQPDIDVEAGLSEAAVQALDEPETRYRLIFAHYLSGSISLARAAELLKMPWLELPAGCLRLDVPLRVAPETQAHAAADIEIAAAW